MRNKRTRMTAAFTVTLFCMSSFSQVALGAENNQGTSIGTTSKNLKVQELKAVTNITASTGRVTLKDSNSTLNVRTGPSTSNTIMGTLHNGDAVQIIGKENNFYKINFNNSTGYVCADYITINSTANSTTSASSKVLTGKVMLSSANSTLNVRTGPSTSNSIIGSLHNGDTLQIVGKENNFYKINYNNKTAYVSADYVTVLSDNGKAANTSVTYAGSIRYFAQDDPQWANKMYSNHKDKTQTIANSGCGPSAFSIVVSTLKGVNVLPTDLCDYSLKIGTRTYNNGTDASFLQKAAVHYNLNYEFTNDINTVKARLNDGKHLVISSMAPGHFTKCGHYIVISGVEVINGVNYFDVYDPHRWNEFYIYDGNLIDNVKDDGFIKAKTSVFENESQGYYIFSK